MIKKNFKLLLLLFVITCILNVSVSSNLDAILEPDDIIIGNTVFRYKV